MTTVIPIEHRRLCEAMGTRFEVFLRGEDEEHLEAIAVAVTDEIERLDGVLSRYDPRSEVSRINGEATGSPVRVDREVFALLEKCEQARQLTEGYFDVTASEGTTDEAPALQLDVESCTVRFIRPDARVDLGGVGKGYALDRGREILVRFGGVTSALLNGGTSSVLALGTFSGQRGWPIDVRHPLTPDAAPVARVELKNRGLSCSGVRRPGQQLSDVVNPRMNQSLTGDAACVVVAASAAEAEIFSTALLAMGREQAVTYLGQNSCHGVDVGWVDPDHEFAWIAP